MLPKSVERVAVNTSPKANREIERKMEINVAHYAALGREAVEERLQELDREWDIERILQANASSLILAGVLLGTRRKAFLALPAAVSAFLLQHALQGWCPPVPILRRLGFRTASEIDRERFALKVLRGDFENTSKGRNGRNKDRVLRAIEAVER